MLFLLLCLEQNALEKTNGCYGHLLFAKPLVNPLDVFFIKYA